MAVVALTTLLVGGREIAAGEVVPETVRFAGRDRPVDVDRLVERGTAERRRAASKSSGSKTSSSRSSADAG